MDAMTFAAARLHEQRVSAQQRELRIRGAQRQRALETASAAPPVVEPAAAACAPAVVACEPVVFALAGPAL